MKIIHILKKEPEESVKTIIQEHMKDHDVRVILLYKDKDYNAIVDLIEKADKIFSW